MVAGGATNAIIQNKGVNYDQFMAMAQACKAAGFQGITLATAREQK
jgi:biopolymer transport protein ExbD